MVPTKVLTGLQFQLQAQIQGQKAAEPGQETRLATPLTAHWEELTPPAAVEETRHANMRLLKALSESMDQKLKEADLPCHT